MTRTTRQILEAMAPVLDARMRPWLGRGVEKVQAAVDQAAAHAITALTETLKATPDGKPTERAVRRSRSYRAATARLLELWDALAGPSIDSTEGLIRDAREDLYRKSFAFWTEHLEGEDPKAAPTRRQVTLARVAIIDGYDLRTEVGAAIRSATADLKRAVTAASNSTTPSRVATDRIRTWQATKGGALRILAARLISDSNVSAHNQALIDLAEEP